MRALLVAQKGGTRLFWNAPPASPSRLSYAVIVQAFHAHGAVNHRHFYDLLFRFDKATLYPSTYDMMSVPQAMRLFSRTTLRAVEEIVGCRAHANMGDDRAKRRLANAQATREFLAMAVEVAETYMEDRRLDVEELASAIGLLRRHAARLELVRIANSASVAASRMVRDMDANCDVLERVVLPRLRELDAAAAAVGDTHRPYVCLARLTQNVVELFFSKARQGAGGTRHMDVAIGRMRNFETGGGRRFLRTAPLLAARRGRTNVDGRAEERVERAYEARDDDAPNLRAIAADETDFLTSEATDAELGMPRSHGRRTARVRVRTGWLCYVDRSARVTDDTTPHLDAVAAARAPVDRIEVEVMYHVACVVVRRT